MQAHVYIYILRIIQQQIQLNSVNLIKRICMRETQTTISTTSFKNKQQQHKYQKKNQQIYVECNCTDSSLTLFHHVTFKSEDKRYPCRFFIDMQFFLTLIYSIYLSKANNHLCESIYKQLVL